MVTTGKKWLEPSGPTEHSLPTNIPSAIARVLMARGIDTNEKLKLFLEPPHKLPHDPLRLSGMDRALQRLYQAVEARELVGVFGDFDVDGITGTAIIARGLEELGVPVVPYLPHRIGEGHGLSHRAVDLLAQRGVGLIITVDCGVTSISEVAKAQESGIDVIITDHHTPLDDLPPAVAIIDPKLPGSQYPFPELSGAGLAFKLVQGIFQYYGQSWSPGLLELAALGTIADLVPLVDENRFLVQEGLKELGHTERPGLLALYRCAGIQNGWVDTETVSFQIAPRLNSSGRMSHAEESLRLLTTKSETEAEELAQRLEQLNQERRDLTEQAFAAANQQVARRTELPPMLIVEDPSITPGIAGLIAGRLAEMYHRPAVVLADLEDGYVTASARSIPDFNLVQAFRTCEHLFVRYGGHAQAAGFTAAKSGLQQLRETLMAAAEASAVGREPVPSLEIDAEIRLADLTPELLHWLHLLEPFGVGNPQPKFLIKGAKVVETRYVGQSGQHLRLRVRQGNTEATALAFNQAENWNDSVENIDLVCYVSTDHWNGTVRTTLKVLDFRSSLA